MNEPILQVLRHLKDTVKGYHRLGLQHIPKETLETLQALEDRLASMNKASISTPLLDGVKNLSELEEMVRSCKKCPLWETRTNPVFGEGPQNSQIMLVGEAPGREEDKTGRPFIGRSGELLTKMLRAINLDRSQVFITSVIKCRPPRNRTPTASEISACVPYLLKQIELINPALILCLGATSARTLLDTDKSLGQLRGRFHPFNGAKILVTYHPAYLLRFGGSKLLNLKRQAWHDLQILQAEYERLKGKH